MNDADRPQGTLPARQFENLPARTAIEHDEPHHDHPPTGRRISLRLVARAFRRHWWQAMLLWAVCSLGLMVLAYARVKPSYIAFAQVRVEPGERGIVTDKGSDSESYTVIKETQVRIMTGPNVLQTALASNPEILTLPKLAHAEDPQAEIRQALSVQIVPKTYLIEVSMASESAQEASDIVNAVVDAYLKNASDNTNQESENNITRLRDLQRDQQAKVSGMRKDLVALQERIGSADVSNLKGRNSVTVDQYTQIHAQLTDVELRIVESEARLQLLQNDAAAPQVPDDAAPGDHELARMFYAEPSVAEVKARLEKAVQQLEQVSQVARDPNDPSRRAPQKTKRDALKQLDALWTDLSPALAAKILAAGRAPAGPDGPVAEVRQSELQLTTLKAQQASLSKKLEKLDIRQKNEGKDAVELEFNRSDLLSSQAMLESITRSLTDLEFENKNPIARIRLEFKASPSRRPSTSSRLKIMAVAPVGVLFGVLSLLVFLELSAGRVVDAEDLPSRVRVPVIGIVPTLPAARQATPAVSGRDDYRAQRQLDQFIQSLDHLRVALCSGKDAWGRERRCVLITSAVSSEGKTTLAAQLAERCVNAGLKTLLIDGDLRNPTLTRMLDVPGGRGLINVLRGEATAEEAMAVVGSSGGFTFMPAGTPRIDPSRLLQSDRFGQLIARAREMFDLIIIDAPPVLPVPDALTMGRWTDGAVLAVRSDMSRFALVEKANRRLVAVGVSVIGAVVNGVKIAETSHESYYPSYAYSNDLDARTPLDV